MVTRLVIATAIGGFLWFLETLLTWYADFISVTLAGVVGTVVSGFVALVLSLLFLPILLTPAWDKWRAVWWISVIVFVVGVVLAIVARLPCMLHEGIDPEFGTHTVYTAHPWFGLAAWLLIMLSVIVCPLLGISRSRRWI